MKIVRILLLSFVALFALQAISSSNLSWGWPNLQNWRSWSPWQQRLAVGTAGLGTAGTLAYLAYMSKDPKVKAAALASIAAPALASYWWWPQAQLAQQKPVDVNVLSEEQQQQDTPEYDDVWAPYKEDDFGKVKKAAFDFLASYKNKVGQGNYYTYHYLKDEFSKAGPNFKADLYTVLRKKDLLSDLSGMVQLQPNNFYLRILNSGHPLFAKYFISKLIHHINSNGSEPTNQDKKRASEHYKIHLMPKKDEFAPLILKIAEILKNNQSPFENVSAAKVYLDYLKSSLDPKKISQSRIPGIILYVQKDAETVQKVLNALFKELEDFQGSGLRPRYNAQVNNLIYIAQGDGDHKKIRRFSREDPLFIYEGQNLIYYDPQKIGEDKNYHLYYPDNPDVEIIEPERPADTYPDSGKGKEKA